MPWWGYLIATLGPYVLQNLLGGNNPATQTTTTTAPPSGYQSPLTGLADIGMFDLLGGRIRDYQGWGGGPGRVSPLFEKILELIGKEGMDLVDLYGRRTIPPGQSTLDLINKKQLGG